MKEQASCKSKMLYFYVNLFNLRGRHHPALANLMTTSEVRKSRPHLKFLAGNYLTYKTKYVQSGGSPQCRICQSGSDETVAHLISSCQSLAEDRNRRISEI